MVSQFQKILYCERGKNKYIHKRKAIPIMNATHITPNDLGYEKVMPSHHQIYADERISMVSESQSKSSSYGDDDYDYDSSDDESLGYVPAVICVDDSFTAPTHEGLGYEDTEIGFYDSDDEEPCSGSFTEVDDAIQVLGVMREDEEKKPQRISLDFGGGRRNPTAPRRLTMQCGSSFTDHTTSSNGRQTPGRCSSAYSHVSRRSSIFRVSIEYGSKQNETESSKTSKTSATKMRCGSLGYSFGTNKLSTRRGSLIQSSSKMIAPVRRPSIAHRSTMSRCA